VTQYPNPLVATTDTSLRGRWRRRPGAIIPALVALLAVAAFFAFGPVGLGNGPLQVGNPDAWGWADPAGTPVALALPMSYAGHDPAVIDSVDIIGGAFNYPAPHVIAIEVLAADPRGPQLANGCNGLQGARPAAGGFAEAGCPSSPRGPLIGSSFEAGHALLPWYAVDDMAWPSGWSPPPRLEAAVEFAGPRPDTCWVATKIVVHYHVGIKHFAATGHAGFSACGTRNVGLIGSAMDASGGEN
jgi:hypothetical protein